MIGIVLGLGAVIGVLRFGGVETLAFAPIQIAVAVLATVVFWRKGWPRVSRPTLLILAFLVSIPFLQLMPLPASIVSAISPARAAMASSIFSSVGLHSDKLALSVNSYATQIAILKLLCYVLVFLLGFQAYREERGRNTLVGVLIGLGVFEAVYGTFQYVTGWQYIFNYAKIYYTQEGTGTYINHNHFAGLLEMVLPFLLARMLILTPAHGRGHHSRWKEIILSPQTSHLLRDIVLFALVCMGLVFSRSRMGIIAGVLSLLVVMTITIFHTRRSSLLFIAFLALALPVAYSAWVGLAPVGDRFLLLEQPEGSGRDRPLVWEDTMGLIRDYPFLGTGLGTYRWSGLRYQAHTLNVVFEHAHNDYLEFAADIGIPVTVLLFGGLWVLAVKVARKTRKLEHTKDRILATGCAGAMMALLTHGIVDFNLQIPANAFIFAWIAGTAAALVTKSISESSERKGIMPVQAGPTGAATR